MVVKKVKYTDFKGNEREEEFRFNISKSELTRMEFGTTGGLSDMLNRIITAQDMPRIMKTFEELLMMSYGEISADGRRFEKSEEMSKAFKETNAYDQIFMELLSNPTEAAKFVTLIMPSDLKDVNFDEVVDDDMREKLKVMAGGEDVLAAIQDK